VSQQRSRPSFRLTDSEIWEFVVGGHTGILTTLRRDGMPIAMPVWFVCINRTIFVHTRGKKLKRIAHDPRASFLVESGHAWSELKAVHFTGVAAVGGLDDALLAQVETEASRKYDAYRTAITDMPPTAAAAYASSMQWIRFTPDDRMLSWDNRKLVGPGS
jgi:Pyridoxamine 5'-phosphate oxidase